MKQQCTKTLVNVPDWEPSILNLVCGTRPVENEEDKLGLGGTRLWPQLFQVSYGDYTESPILKKKHKQQKT